MQGDGGFYGPLAYQPIWPWIGVMLFLLVLAWFGWLLLPARRSAVRRGEGPVTVRGTDIQELKRRCLSAIDGIEGAAGTGELTSRTAHQQLSLLVRRFVQDAGGAKATRMTLRELRDHVPASVARFVEGIYPEEFGPHDGAPPAANSAAASAAPGVAAAARAARQVVRSWN